MSERFAAIMSLLVITLLFVISGCNRTPVAVAPTNIASDRDSEATQKRDWPKPANEGVHEEDENNEELRRQWIEELHRCRPDVDWQAVNRRNANLLANLRPAALPRSTAESFANGQLKGVWSDRGSVNQSGSMDAICYVPSTDQVYAFGGELSNYIGGRSLWKGNRDGSGWTLLNDDYGLRADMLEALIPSGNSTVRLFASDAKELLYSDDEGQSWSSPSMDPEMGFQGFGRRLKIKKLPSDNDTLFYLVITWDPDPWSYRTWLYRSTDSGLNFDRIEVFTETDRRKIDLWAPESGGTVYVLENSSQLNTYTANTQNSTTCSGLPANRNEYQLTGSLNGGLTLYALIDGEDIYRSINGGANWSFVSTAPINAWDVGMTCSPNDSDVLIIGGVNSYVSTNGGVDWQLVNEWWEYYQNIDLLHADMMEFEWGQTTSGTDFLMIGNHGGIHVSYDEMATTTNIAKLGLNVCMYYDVLTHPTMTNIVFLGAQDQGFQWTDTADTPGPMNVVQQVSGDYGQLHLTRNNQSYWQQYPGAFFTYYHDATSTTSSNNSFDLNGSHLPSWIVPTGKIRSDEAANAILVGGGNLDGGSGSHLVKLTRAAGSGITGTQYNYDFRANSNSGTARISAIEQPAHDPDIMYVTTNDGSFFRTTDGGTNWQRTQGFQVADSSWIFTSTILASRTNTDVVWTSGSGYSNPPVFKSEDGGVTFSEMSNGLPDTLVQEIVANPAETMLFAATDVGPFVYIVADDQWYPLLGAQTPINWFTSVEFVESLNTVRFATMGRGVWDFKIDYADTYPTEDVEITRGVLVAGGVAELEDSDNVDLSIRRSGASILSTLEFTSTVTFPTRYPNRMTCKLEGAVFARGQVTQVVEVLNVNNGNYVEVDSRPARRFSDLVAEFDLPGNLTRFIDPATGQLQARIRYTSLNPRQAFSANIDQLTWELE